MSPSPEAYLHTPTAYEPANGPEAQDAGTHATTDVTDVHESDGGRALRFLTALLDFAIYSSLRILDL